MSLEDERIFLQNSHVTLKAYAEVPDVKNPPDIQDNQDDKDRLAPTSGRQMVLEEAEYNLDSAAARFLSTRIQSVLVLLLLPLSLTYNRNVVVERYFQVGECSLDFPSFRQ